MRNIEIRENTNEVIRYPEDMYCVYFHQDPDTDEVIYVGKGTLHRAYQITNRSYDHHVWLLDKLDTYKIQDIVKIKGGQMTDKEATIVEAHEIKCCLRRGSDLLNVAQNPFRKTRRMNAEYNRLSGAENTQHASTMGSKASTPTRVTAETTGV